MNAVTTARPAEATMAMDTLVRFGPGNQLTGVLAGSARERGPILLLPSAGLQPRAGPFRLHVELARRLSAQGIRSFRYDIPGVGEAPRLTACDASRATIAAIDHLQAQHGGNTFAVGGICSAADTGWEVAIQDRRVSALLLLDGICFAGPWYRYARVLNLLRRLPREWRRFARMVPRRLRGNGSLDSNVWRTWPTHAQARQQFAELVARDVRMLCIFSGGYGERFLHPRQFEWTFGPPARDPRVAMHYWPDCDHTYFGRAQRERLIDAIEGWMASLPERSLP
jgi:hypothetical protein